MILFKNIDKDILLGDGTLEFLEDDEWSKIIPAQEIDKFTVELSPDELFYFDNGISVVIPKTTVLSLKKRGIRFSAKKKDTYSFLESRVAGDTLKKLASIGASITQYTPEIFHARQSNFTENPIVKQEVEEGPRTEYYHWWSDYSHNR